MKLIILMTALAVSSLSGQAAERGKPLGSWNVEYDRVVQRMHGEPTQRHEHGQMTLRSVGDSLIGELVIRDSTAFVRSGLRGVAGKTVWVLYVEDPAPRGFGILSSAFAAAMDWLRQSIHGIQPVVVRFDVTARGDSLRGTRFVTGGMGAPRNSPVLGARARP